MYLLLYQVCQDMTAMATYILRVCVQLNTGWIFVFLFTNALCGDYVTQGIKTETATACLKFQSLLHVIEKKTPLYVNVSLIRRHFKDYLQCNCNHPHITRSERSNHYNYTLLSFISSTSFQSLLCRSPSVIKCQFHV